MSIIGYARVSANNQSLDIQIEKLMKAGCTKIFREKISGVAKIKPELSSLMEYIREGDTVIVTKLDRIARSTKHLLEIVDSLEEKSVKKVIFARNVQFTRMQMNYAETVSSSCIKQQINSLYRV